MPSDPINRVKDHLNNVWPNGSGSSARCPAHDDHHNSLSITPGKDGRVLLNCHAGCSTDKILDSLGLEWKDLFREQSEGPSSEAKSGTEKTTYPYRDRHGNPYMAIKREPNKGFVAYRYEDGKLQRGLNSHAPILYRLDAVTEAVDQGRRVFIVEGEKDADRLATHGFAATCNPFGAGKWRDRYSEALHDAHVVILPDNDQPGRDHAEQVARSLQGIAASVKRVDLPGLAEGEDVSDWLDAGHCVDELTELVHNADLYEPEAPSGATDDPNAHAKDALQEAIFDFDLSPEAREPESILIDGLLNAGDLMLWAGREKQRKSTLALQFVTCLAAGEPFLSFEIPEPVRVLYVDGESKDTDLAERWAGVETHLDEAALDRAKSNLTIVKGRDLITQGHDLDTPHLEKLLREHADSDLVVFDPLRVFFGGDENDSAAITQYYTRLRQLVEGRALCVIHHVRKQGQAQAEPLRLRDDPHLWSDTIRGSNALKAHADSIMLQELRDDDRMGEILDVATIARSHRGLAPLALVASEHSFAWHERLAEQDTKGALDQLKESERAVYNAAQTHVANASLTRSELVKQLVADEVKSRAQCYRLVNRLIDIGLLAETPDGKVQAV